MLPAPALFMGCELFTQELPDGTPKDSQIIVHPRGFVTAHLPASFSHVKP